MKKTVLVLISMLFSYQIASSSGFQINDHSARSIGMGFSTVANINDASALFYNPAAMSFFKSELSVSAGIAYIMPGAKFTGITDLKQQYTTATESWNFLIPHCYIGWKTPIEGLSVGAAVFVPFGLGTRWPSDWVGRHSALETYLQTIEINPNVAYQFNIGEIPISISAGFGFCMGDVELNKYLDVVTPEPLLKLTGDGTGTTFNFGLNVQPMKDLKVGASYRHSFEIEYDGKIKYENITGIESLFQECDGGTKIEFPNDLRFGIAYQVIENLWIEAGISYTGWSSYDSLIIDFDKAPGNPATSYTSRLPRLYEDIIAYRIGAEYQLNDCIALRCGFYHDPVPVDPDYIEPVLPEGNRYCGSVGVGYKFCNCLSADLAYLGIYTEQTEAKHNPNQFNGIYNIWANIISLTFNYNY